MDKLALEVVKALVHNAQIQGVPEIQAVCHQGHRGQQATKVQRLGGDLRALAFLADILKQTGKLLGAQLMCERASDIISEFTQALSAGMTREEMAQAVRPHPTFSEAVTEALRA